ncbi:hypothetical protein BGZ98_004412, partial [Dissophora globulifera]
RSYELTVRALVSFQEKAECDIRAFVVEPVIGSLEDYDLLTPEAGQSDVLNFTDADNLTTIKAILKSLQHCPHRHDAARKQSIMIHTSGIGVLLDNAHGNIAGASSGTRSKECLQSSWSGASSKIESERALAVALFEIHKCK